MIKYTRLNDLKTTDEGLITKVFGQGAFRKRITEMGFVKGQKVTVIKNAPLQDPVEYEIMNYRVSLRRSEAQLVEVVALEDASSLSKVQFSGTLENEFAIPATLKQDKIITVALVGNPNCGKTTLFNYASGSRERVGNYGGVTVDAKEATMKKDNYLFQIVDLPGTYSITEYSPEELFVRAHITDKRPDIVVNVIDASNIGRNLFLTTQLIDMNIKVVIALNMYDELEQRGASLDFATLGKLIGIPVIPTVASKGTGIDELFQKVIDVYEERDATVRHIHINYGQEIEKAIFPIQQEIRVNKETANLFSTRYLAIKLLESDTTTLTGFKKYHNFDKIVAASSQAISKLEKVYGEKAETIITDAKYGFIDGALKETYTPGIEDREKRKWEIDNILTHKILGFPVFIFFMWLMFQGTFTLGSYPMEWINLGMGLLGDFFQNLIPVGPLRDLIVDGMIGGVGGVIVFLPNILIIFFFISLMEDTGYMARASFIMDRLMHKIGLHGKSFIPLLMGFGCNVPAMMATRTLENKKDRLLTMMITPFMSCSARLPVYVLFISAFFPKNQGLILFSIYFIGVALAVIVALVMKRLMFAKQDVPFVMELPPYRIPTLKSTTMHMWHKGVQYLNKMGTVILTASIIIWALGYYPRNVQTKENYENQIQKVQSDSRLSGIEKEKQTLQIKRLSVSDHQEKSYIGQLGHAIEPVIRPLGFDWKIGVCIITGVAAKEIVVSTMGVLYQADEGATASLKEKLRQQEYSNGDMKGQKVFTPLVAFCFMIFVLIYAPCVAAMAALKKESNWKWALFTVTYTTCIAWIVSFLTYQIGTLFF